MDAFRTRKETIKATYTAAEAQTRINEAFSGISEEMGDVGMAIQRAEDKTAQMQARAGAIDELLASGALEDVSGGGPRDDIQAELDRMGAGNDVELELAEAQGRAGQRVHARAGGRYARPGPAAPSAPRTASSNGEQAFPAADVGESALPSAEPPRAGDGT